MGLRNHSLTLQPQFSSRDRVRAHPSHEMVGVPKDELLWVPGKLKTVRKITSKLENKELVSHLSSCSPTWFQ
jgi:hypothetical protein